MNTMQPMNVGPEPISPSPAMSAAVMPADEGSNLSVDLRRLWSTFYRNGILVAIIVVLSLLVGLAVTMLSRRQYRAEASVQVEQQSTRVLSSDDTDAEPDPAIQDAERFLQTQVDILNTRSLAIRVMNTLKLADTNDFIVAMGDDPNDLVVAPGTTLQDARRNHVLGLLSRGLAINLPANSRIARIDFSSPHPALSAKVANTFATEFINSNLQRRFDTSLYARNFLRDQLVDARARLEASERSLVAYARTAGLIDPGLENDVGTPDQPQAGGIAQQSLTTADLIQANADYTKAQTDRVAAQQHWEQAQKTPLMTLPEVLANPAVTQLTQARAQAQAAYQQELQHHQAGYPTMVQAAAQIAELDNQINKIALNVRDTIKNAYLVARGNENALSGNVNTLKQATFSEQDRSIRYVILRREVETDRLMYDSLLQRFGQISAAAGITANNISLIDTAEAPTLPYSPQPLVNLAAALVFGLALASIVVFLKEKFDDAIRSPEDVPAKLGVRLLNTIPLLRGNVTVVEAMDDPRSPLSEAYAALRASLELVTEHGLPRSILLTSSRQSEGKSTTAYAIARDFAKIGRTVLLIDCDLRRPSLHRTIGLDNRVGFSNLLARHRTLDQVLQETDTPNLSFIGSGQLPPDPAELLSGLMLPAVLREMTERFDLVVADGPPVLGLADAVLLAAKVEGTVFVVEANGSHQGHAKAALRRISSVGATMLGVLLTKFDARKIGYGYEYGYSYSYGQATEDKVAEPAPAVIDTDSTPA